MRIVGGDSKRRFLLRVTHNLYNLILILKNAHCATRCNFWNAVNISGGRGDFYYQNFLKENLKLIHFKFSLIIFHRIYDVI